MSEVETAAQGSRLTPELVDSLQWPDVDLGTCELVKTGVVIGFDRDEGVIEYEHQDETVDGRDKQWVFGVLQYAGVVCHPPMEGGHPLDTGQTFWLVREPVKGKQAILRQL